MFHFASVLFRRLRGYAKRQQEVADDAMLLKDGFSARPALFGQKEMFAVLVDKPFFEEYFHCLVDGGLGNAQLLCHVHAMDDGLRLGEQQNSL